MDTASATALLDQLQTFSRRWLASVGLPPEGAPQGDLSPNGSDHWRAGHPTGVVMHFTADARFKTCADWLCSVASEDSAHFLVAADRMVDPTDKLYDGCPLLRMLPTTVLMLRLPGHTANHATWANSWAIGIENVNTGEVRYDARTKHYSWWPNDWKASYTGPVPTSARGRLWAPFPTPQLHTNALLVNAVSALWLGRIEPARVVGHDMVQGVDTKKADGTRLNHDKRDLGPCFPIHVVRDAGTTHIESERSVEATLRRITTDVRFADASPDFTDRYRQELKVANKTDVLHEGFHALGYRVDTPAEQQTSRDIFATMMGMHQSLNQASTQAWAAALLRRLDDRFGRTPPVA